MRLLKKCLTFILCLTLLMQGAAYAFTYENGTELSSSDLSFQSTNGEEIRVSDLLQERKMVLIHFFRPPEKAAWKKAPSRVKGIRMLALKHSGRNISPSRSSWELPPAQ